MLFEEVNYVHRKKIKYVVPFCDFRGMKVLRDENGRKTPAFGTCFGS